MNIAVIGTGNVGAALGTGWAKAGHTVVFGARQPKRPDVQALVARSGTSALVPAEAAAQAEVVVLATPWRGLEQIIAGLGDVRGKIVVDATNPIGPGFKLVGDPSGGEMVQQWAAGAHVIKAFNTTGFENMADASYPGDISPAMFLAGDDAQAKDAVTTLAEALGFEAIDAGPLSRSALLEHTAMLWITQAIVEGAGRNIAFAVLRR